MSEEYILNPINTIPLKNLMQTGSVKDTDILVIEDETTTYKITASDLTAHIRNAVKDTFLQSNEKGEANGIVPLDSNVKIASSYLQYGKTAGSVYQGCEGKTLEENLELHKQDRSNPHGLTGSQLGLGNVENKSSEAIRSEITAGNVIAALGFTPEISGAYENAVKYVEAKIAEIIDNAPDTLNTLNEIAQALSKNQEVVDTLNTLISAKASQAELDTHTGNGIIHVTATDKSNLASALSHSKSTHARADAAKVENSPVNGCIKINDNENTVYEHPLSGVSAGTYRQITVDAGGHVTGGNNETLPITQGGTGADTASKALENMGLTATASELNKLDGVNTTTKEFNYLHGTTQNIQVQIDAKADKNHGAHLPDITESSSNQFAVSNGTAVEWHGLNADDITNALGYVPGTGSNVITAVKGEAEAEYQTGNVNITPAKIGLGKVNNTADSEKSVAAASKLSTLRNIDGVQFNGTKNIIHYGVCSTAANIAEKTVECGQFALITGACIKVKFTVTNTVAAPITLNINQTGAKTIKYRGNPQGGSWFSADRILEFVYDGTDWCIVGELDTNNSVVQTDTNTSADYRMLLSYDSNDTTRTVGTRKSKKFLANPGTGEFFAEGYRRTDLTGSTLDIDTLTLSSGSPCISHYVAKTCVGTANITNTPVADQPFILDVELIRWATDKDYVTMQTFRVVTHKNNEFVRYCTNGVWTGWTARVFTDTKNTSGSTNTSAKLFLIGAASQAASPVTYSHDTAYVGTDGCLYSNNTRVTTELVSAAEPAGLLNGDYWIQEIT